MRTTGACTATVLGFLLAGTGVGPAVADPGGAVTARVFATREGLVGRTTANGHVITDRDHFVALPSRRGLSSKGTGTYTVRVCGDATGRCAYAPVWDVGPWNTRDDYWNQPREMWPGLARGLPESQAAVQSGYNGGRDEFGRTVQNPAGIDLADGTFWDGVGLTDNGWLTVTYLWTASGPRGAVDTGGGPLNLRSGPGRGYSRVGMVGDYSQVVVECQTRGEYVVDGGRASDRWDRIGPGHWISHAYVTGGPYANC